MVVVKKVTGKGQLVDEKGCFGSNNQGDSKVNSVVK
jgi:hypothetical protein